MKKDFEKESEETGETWKVFFGAEKRFFSFPFFLSSPFFPFSLSLFLSHTHS